MQLVEQSTAGPEAGTEGPHGGEMTGAPMRGRPFFLTENGRQNQNVITTIAAVKTAVVM